MHLLRKTERLPCDVFSSISISVQGEFVLGYFECLLLCMSNKWPFNFWRLACGSSGIDCHANKMIGKTLYPIYSSYIIEKMFLNPVLCIDAMEMSSRYFSDTSIVCVEDKQGSKT